MMRGELSLSMPAPPELLARQHLYDTAVSNPAAMLYLVALQEPNQPRGYLELGTALAEAARTPAGQEILPPKLAENPCVRLRHGGYLQVVGYESRSRGRLRGPEAYETYLPKQDFRDYKVEMIRRVIGLQLDFPQSQLAAIAGGIRQPVVPNTPGSSSLRLELYARMLAGQEQDILATTRGYENAHLRTRILFLKKQAGILEDIPSRLVLRAEVAPFVAELVGRMYAFVYAGDTTPLPETPGLQAAADILNRPADIRLLLAKIPKRPPRVQKPKETQEIKEEAPPPPPEPPAVQRVPVLPPRRPRRVPPRAAATPPRPTSDIVEEQEVLKHIKAGTFRTTWFQRAGCNRSSGANPNLFTIDYPAEESRKFLQTRPYCRPCPVRGACLKMALINDEQAAPEARIWFLGPKARKELSQSARERVMRTVTITEG